MITYEEAIKIINDVDVNLLTENVSIRNCLGRVLANDVFSDIDMPPFNKSAMDGYAIRREDLNLQLEVLETIKAGDLPTKRIQANQCSKIMTGAIIPEGADCVIVVELTELLPDGKVKFTGTDTRNNISFKAEDIKKGELVLRKGTLLRPQEIAILATTGCTEPLVFKTPKVAIATTGDEIVEPQFIPEKGKIRNSNAYQLIGQVQRCGINADYLGIVGDTEAELERFLHENTPKYDIIIMTGGISMGDFDFLPKVIKKTGMDLLFQKIAIKPGKPTVFGKKDKGFIFALPGNPVSSYIIFELFTKTLLYRMSGLNYKPIVMNLHMHEDFYVKKSDRLSWIPVMLLEDGSVKPVSYHGSAHVFALCHAEAIMPVEAGLSKICKGEIVHVRQI
ncbi:MAG: molybdopterin molybdotransferase MoeA [Bacteroidales bacterium]|nr:molybdopterin molybdotransferase MoeA [Bacteroidales bacterium]